MNTEYSDAFSAVIKLSAKCSCRLISDKKDGAFRSPEVMLQMMLDPSGLTHTTGRKDHLRIRVEVDVLGILTGN